jgi:hypothetical protein
MFTSDLTRDGGINLQTGWTAPGATTSRPRILVNTTTTIPVMTVTELRITVKSAWNARTLAVSVAPVFRAKARVPSSINESHTVTPRYNDWHENDIL